MRVIKQGKDPHSSVVQCNYCDAVLEMDVADWAVNDVGEHWAKCPCCTSRMLKAGTEWLTEKKGYTPDKHSIEYNKQFLTKVPDLRLNRMV